MINLTLRDIINVSVNVSPLTSLRQSFDSALILGDSAVVSTADRIQEYATLAEMITDGFTTADPEYKAARLYFGQSSVPNRVYVGVKGVDPETLLEAVTACREISSEWYALIVCDDLVATESDSELLAIATYVETCDPPTILGLSLTTASYLATLGVLKNADLKRTIVQYDDPIVNEVNEGITSIAGILGYAMGENKSSSASFNLAYKPINGLTSMSSLTNTELTEILVANGNVLIKQGYYYNIFRQGKMANGDYFDEVLNLDMLINDMQAGIMDQLVSLPKVPQTEDGVDVLTNAISVVLNKYVGSKFIQSGTWLGAQVLSLKTGDTLSTGYIIQFESLSSQSAEDRTARIAPDCYVCIKLAGAIEHIAIKLNVSR